MQILYSLYNKYIYILNYNIIKIIINRKFNINMYFICCRKLYSKQIQNVYIELLSINLLMHLNEQLLDIALLLYLTSLLCNGLTSIGLTTKVFYTTLEKIQPSLVPQYIQHSHHALCLQYFFNIPHVFSLPWYKIVNINNSCGILQNVQPTILVFSLHTERFVNAIYK